MSFVAVLPFPATVFCEERHHCEGRGFYTLLRIVDIDNM